MARYRLRHSRAVRRRTSWRHPLGCKGRVAAVAAAVAAAAKEEEDKEGGEEEEEGLGAVEEEATGAMMQCLHPL